METGSVKVRFLVNTQILCNHRSTFRFDRLNKINFQSLSVMIRYKCNQKLILMRLVIAQVKVLSYLVNWPLRYFWCALYFIFQTA